VDCHVWLRLGKDLPQGEVDVLRGQSPEVKFSVDAQPADYSSITAVFTNSRLPDELAAQLPALKWVHTTYGGGLSYLTPSVVARGIAVTSSRGVQAEALSEFTEACVLAFAKKFLTLARLKQERSWDETVRPDTLAGKVAGLLGLGAVGSAVAQRLHKQGMSVRAIRRNIHDVPSYVDSVHAMDRLPDLLRECDFLIIGLPANEALRGLIGERELQSMKKTSYLINLVTRDVVDDMALLRALQNGWIAGAACNVFEGGPLPPESPLWDAPNLIVSPNVAQGDPQRWKKLKTVFSDNLARYLSGQPMVNLVNGTNSN
jgi:phosphoglycerate dehydrogenase-like enzyme